MAVRLGRTFGRAAAIVVLASTYAVAGPGDKLFINGENVNVRSGPGLTFKVVIQLDRGRELLEIARQDDWIHAIVFGSGNQDGWVHAPLVSQLAPTMATAAPSDPKFSEFRTAVVTMNASVRQPVGANYFDHIENLGDGVVQLTATSTWLGQPRAEQQGNLDTLFIVWNAAERTGPTQVRIVDRSGKLVMEKQRR